MNRTPPNWHYARTALAQHYLNTFEIGAASVVLFAPRGKGKTYFMLNDVIPLAKQTGFEPVYVNFWSDNERPAEVVVRALVRAIVDSPQVSAALKARVLGMTAEVGMELQAQVGPVQGKVGAKTKTPASMLADANRSPLARMEDLCDALQRDVERPLLLIFDEVQTLASRPEHEGFVRSLRTLLDERRGRVYSIFTGSSQAKLTDMFQRIRAPLYNFARNDTLPAMDDGFLQHWLGIIQAISGPGCPIDLAQMRQAFDLTERTPRIFWSAVQDMLLSQSTQLERHVRTAVMGVQANAGVVQRLRELTPLDRAVLLEVVKQHLARRESGQVLPETQRLFGEGARQRMRAGLGMTPTPQQVQSSLRRLTGKELQLLVPRGRGIYEIEDEFFLKAIADVLVRQADPVLSDTVLSEAASEAQWDGAGGTKEPDALGGGSDSSGAGEQVARERG